MPTTALQAHPSAGGLPTARWASAARRALAGGLGWDGAPNQPFLQAAPLPQAGQAMLSAALAAAGAGLRRAAAELGRAGLPRSHQAQAAAALTTLTE